MNCIVCNEAILENHDWIGFNRYCVGTGGYHRLLQAIGEDDCYYWDMDNIKESPTMFVAHWPICAIQFIEGSMAEIRVTI